MDEQEKVYYPQVIEDTPFPLDEGEVSFASTQKSANDVHTPSEISSQGFPTRKIAYEVLASSLNTKSRKILSEFQFTKSGAIQIGEYANGVSGDIRISPNGIVARDSTGAVSFTLDGDTGSAVFRGEIQAGAFISGLVVVGDNSIVIDGETKRLVFYDENDIPVILIGNA